MRKSMEYIMELLHMFEVVWQPIQTSLVAVTGCIAEQNFGWGFRELVQRNHTVPATLCRAHDVIADGLMAHAHEDPQGQALLLGH
jgi:hypothetical protein